MQQPAVGPGLRSVNTCVNRCHGLCADQALGLSNQQARGLAVHGNVSIHGGRRTVNIVVLTHTLSRLTRF